MQARRAQGAGPNDPAQRRAIVRLEEDAPGRQGGREQIAGEAGVLRHALVIIGPRPLFPEDAAARFFIGSRLAGLQV